MEVKAATLKVPSLAEQFLAAMVVPVAPAFLVTVATEAAEAVSR
jgi:hypothetical protein